MPQKSVAQPRGVKGRERLYFFGSNFSVLHFLHLMCWFYPKRFHDISVTYRIFRSLNTTSLDDLLCYSKVFYLFFSKRQFSSRTFIFMKNYLTHFFDFLRTLIIVVRAYTNRKVPFSLIKYFLEISKAAKRSNDPHFCKIIFLNNFP